MKKIRFAFLAIGIALVATNTWAAEASNHPFGFDITKEPSEYSFCSKHNSKKYWYVCTTAPKLHPEFEAYYIQYIKGIGGCIIKGLGETIRNDSYGISTKKKVDVIVKQIAKKYNRETKKFDFLLPSSIWDDVDDWMMGIAKEQRLYAYFWETKDGFKPIEAVSRIVVAAQAVANDAGYVAVEFGLTNEATCKKEIEKDGQDSF